MSEIKYAVHLYKRIINGEVYGRQVFRGFNVFEEAEKFAKRHRSYEGYNIQTYWER